MIKDYVVRITDDRVPNAFREFEQMYLAKPLTRCRDCRWYKKETLSALGGRVTETFTVCTRSGGIEHLGLPGDAFCSFGEKVESDG